MTCPALRQYIVGIVAESRIHVGWEKISTTLKISEDTLQRWCSTNGFCVDKRALVNRPVPENRLSNEERQAIIDTCNKPCYDSLPPESIVADLADKGVYIASASTFYRVLRERKQIHHRGRSKSPVNRSIPRLSAENPNKLWSWDITYLPGPAKGLYFYLYLIMDVYSRKIVGAEVYDCESGELAAELLQKSVLREGGSMAGLILHSDNGSPMKASSMRAKLVELKVTSSHSRPHTSNDNPFSESLFKTLKYCPEYPDGGFATIEEARQWVHDFVKAYNNEHKHSGIAYVTPALRHSGEDVEVLRKRKAVYLAAREKTPSRWSGDIKRFESASVVWINKPKEIGKVAG